MRDHVATVAVMLESQFPTVAAMLNECKGGDHGVRGPPGGVLAQDMVDQIIERLNKEVKRRTDVVGIFPDPAALLRLARCVLIEAHDE